MKWNFEPLQVRRSLKPAKIGLMLFLLCCAALAAWSWLDGAETAPENTQLALAEAHDLPGPDQDEQTTTEQIPEPDASLTTAAYFAAYRLDREQARAEELTLLQQIIDDQGGSPAIREEAEARRLHIAGAVEREARAESLLLAKGCGETVVLLGQTQATVIVDLEMDAQKAVQIAEIVDSCCECGFENVVIVNR